MLAVMAVALTIQLRTTKYTPWIYWLCVVLVSIVGTQITDFFTDTLGVSLYLSTAVFSVILAVVFTIWYRQEGTLEIAPSTPGAASRSTGQPFWSRSPWAQRLATSRPKLSASDFAMARSSSAR